MPEDKEDDNKRLQLEKTTHEEIQLLLLKLGSELGLDVWVVRNDRNREFNGENFQDIPSLRRDLPRQFDDATNKIIELIDVLWLQGDAIIAAFEVCLQPQFTLAFKNVRFSKHATQYQA